GSGSGTSISGAPSQERSAPARVSSAWASPTAAADGELASMLSAPPEAPTRTWSVPVAPEGDRARWRRSRSPGARRRTSSRTPVKEGVVSRFTAEPPAERCDHGIVGVLPAGAVHAAQHGEAVPLRDEVLHRADGERVHQQHGEQGRGGAGLGAVGEGER